MVRLVSDTEAVNLIVNDAIPGMSLLQGLYGRVRTDRSAFRYRVVGAIHPRGFNYT